LSLFSEIESSIVPKNYVMKYSGAWR